jgi:hypothetical protein
MLSEWEILSTCELLLFAGNVTTTDLTWTAIVLQILIAHQ